MNIKYNITVKKSETKTNLKGVHKLYIIHVK